MKTTMTTIPIPTLASQNDAFRKRPTNGWMLTKGVHDNGPDFVAAALSAVTAFDAFTTENDPHGEHDFGALSVAGKRLFWKIDYYDRQLEFGSPDPADPVLTRRVLTVMLAEEY